MARVIVSSSALSHQLVPHACDSVQLRIAGGRCSLWSEEATTAVPCESNWTGVATVNVQALLWALARIEDQPITLDLHESIPSKLYAYRVEWRDGAPGDYEPLIFDL